MADGQFIIMLISLTVTVIGSLIAGFWTIGRTISVRIDGVYNRMDERFEEADIIFVRKDVYETERRNQEEKLDLRLNSNMQIIVGKFESMEKSVNRIEDWIKENFTNHAKSIGK